MVVLPGRSKKRLELRGASRIAALLDGGPIANHLDALQKGCRRFKISQRSWVADGQPGQPNLESMGGRTFLLSYEYIFTVVHTTLLLQQDPLLS